MTAGSSENEYPTMRRHDRAADDSWIRQFLNSSPFGFLATAADGKPYIHPNTFVFADGPDSHRAAFSDSRAAQQPKTDKTSAFGAIYVHTAATGHLRSTIEANGNVCFCVSEIGRLLPAKVALEFSVEYASVVAFGRATIVDDAIEAEAALQKLLDKYAHHLRPGRDYRPITEDELRRTAVYRIDIDHWTGKKKEAPADFPGAFSYRPDST